MRKLYSPWQIHKLSDGEINRAYSELRSIANKRLQRQQAQNIGIRARTGFRFPTIADINASSKDTVAAALADVSAFLRSDRTTIKGEKKAISEFRDRISGMGYGDLVKDLDSTYDTMKYLDQLREEYSDQLYDSGDVLEVLQQAQNLNIDKALLEKHINKFYEHQKEFLKIKVPKRKGYTPVAVQRMINKYTV